MCAENQYVRIITKVAQGEPTIPPSPSHNNGDWLATDIYEGELYIDSDTGKIYTRLASGIVDIGAVSSANIYNTDGALPTGATRTFDLDTGKLFQFGGKIFFGTDDPEWFFPAFELPHLFQIKGDGTHGMIVANASDAGYSYSAEDSGNGFLADFPGDGSAFIARMGDVNSIGLNLKASHNKIFDSDITPDPTNIPSSVFTVWSTRKGSLPVPRLTEVERDAIASPADYLEIVNTTKERKEIYRPFWGWHPVGEITPDWGYSMRDECINVSPVDGFTQNILNGGTRNTRLDVSVNGSPVQLIGFSTGTASNGESSHYLNGYFPGGTGKKQYETKASVSALSTLADRYISKVGYTTTNTGFPTDGMYFLYDEGGASGSATASANWLCVCRNGGSYSVVDSGVAVNTTSNPLHNLKIRDYGTGNKVEFIINGVIVATITTNIPDSTKIMYIGERIVKTTGATARLLYIDYSSVKEKFNTPR